VNSRDAGARAPSTVPSVVLPSGDTLPLLGKGTAGLAEGRHPAEQELAALRLGLDLGMSLIGTSESYADGGPSGSSASPSPGAGRSPSAQRTTSSPRWAQAP
jgi:hypothetical protein